VIVKHKEKTTLMFRKLTLLTGLITVGLAHPLNGYSPRAHSPSS
jgi:hypothetical protein